MQSKISGSKKQIIDGALICNRRLAPTTQLISTAAIGINFAGELPLCMMLQTMAFVVFNKVSGIGEVRQQSCE